MKHTQLIGILAALVLVFSCFLPWIYVPSLQVSFSGINGKVNDTLSFGKQILSNGFLAGIMIILFLTPKLWAKRINIFFGFLIFGWAIKNFILFSICRPECPTKLFGLYLMLSMAFVMMVCTFIPKIDISINPKNADPV